MNPGDTLAGRFEIEAPAGTGGMATVYRARDRHAGAPVAVKLFQGEGAHAERFTREATLLAELSHPGIVRYVAHGVTPDGAQFLVMEWIEGETLSRRLARDRLSVAESVTLLQRVCHALASAHQLGVVHRDLKPSNLVLAEGAIDRVKLIDFGVARRTREAIGLTVTGAVVGTPGYMSPEQARGEADVDARSDVFALGCVLFECLTGTPAFYGNSPMAVQAKILLDEVPRVKELRVDVPESIDALLARMLTKDPEARPADAGALAQDLDELDLTTGRVVALRESPDALGGATRSLRAVTSAPTGRWRALRDGDTQAPTEVSDPPVVHESAPGVRTSALTASEQRVVCVVLARAPTGGAADPERARMLRRAVEPYAARLEILAGGAVVVTLSGVGAATDQGARAARSALAMRPLLGRAPMALVTGRAVVAARLPVGDVIDRGMRLLEDAPPDAIRLDEATAGLLDRQFDVGGDRGGLVLRGERSGEEGARTLLGRATSCVGRDRELGALLSVFDECAGEPVARAVLVTAPAGAGKSRLRYELVHRLRERDEPVELLLGQGDSLAAGSPFGLLAPALRRSAGIRDGEPLEVRRQKLRARMARHLAGAELRRACAFLGEMVSAPLPDDGDGALASARRDPILMGDAMRAAWEEWLAAESAVQPVVLILDDLQWGDRPSVQFVDAALRNLRDRPLLVLALARPDVHRQFPGLWAERELQEIRLPALTRRASERLVREALGAELSARVVGQLVDRAEGNAFYLEELIRAIAAGREEGLPDTVLGMVQARLDALGPEAKRVLRAASVFGKTFWRGGIQALLGDGETRPTVVGDWLDELAAREVVFRQGPGELQGEVEYVFRHELLREAAYAMLTDADRTLGHRLAARWLERVGATDATALAEHFHRGGEPARALGWFRRGAEQALEGDDLAAAIDRAERGAGCGADGEALGALRLIQAEAHRWRGEHAQAERRAVEAADVVTAGGAAWFRAAGQAILAAGQQGGFDRVEEWLRRAGEERAGPDALSSQVICLCRGAIRLLHAGRRDVAAPLIARVAALVGDPPEARLEPLAAVRVHQLHVVEALHAGDLGAMLVRQEAVVATFDRAHDGRNGCLERCHLGLVYGELGEHGRAETTLRQALQSAQRIGLHQTEAWALHYLGGVLARVGRLPEAQTCERQAAEAGRRQRDPRLEGSARVHLAMIAYLAGHVEEAEREAAQAIALLEAAPPLLAGALAARARALVGLGRAKEGLAPARAAMSLLVSLGGIEGGEAYVRLVFAEVLSSLGDGAAARSVIATARDRLHARAATIGDSVLRESFLRRHPDNARTLDLAEAWQV